MYKYIHMYFSCRPRSKHPSVKMSQSIHRIPSPTTQPPNYLPTSPQFRCHRMYVPAFSAHLRLHLVIIICIFHGSSYHTCLHQISAHLLGTNRPFSPYARRVYAWRNPSWTIIDQEASISTKKKKKNEPNILSPRDEEQRNWSSEIITPASNSFSRPIRERWILMVWFVKVSLFAVAGLCKSHFW